MEETSEYNTKNTNCYNRNHGLEEIAAWVYM